MVAEIDGEEYKFEDSSCVYMVDIDINDAYVELIFEGDGPGGNQHISMTRIINGKLITIGDINGMLIVNNELGYLVQKNAVLLFGTSPIIGRVSYIEANKICEKNNMTTPISFSSTQEQMVDFIPDKPNETRLVSGIQTFKAGTKFTIYSCDTDNNWNVEINGVKGIMNLQVAG